MEPRTRSSLLWGAIGALSFLVLVQGHELLGDAGVGLSTKVAVALAVGIAATVLSYLGEGWYARRARE